jgi:RND family efflux transporter MFP subunit
MLNFTRRHKKFTVGIVIIITLVILTPRLLRPKTSVVTTTIQRGEVVSTLLLSGEIDATQKVTLQFQTPARLVGVYVKEGDTVKKGQLIAKLDTVLLNSNYQQALSAWRATTATVDRVHDSLKDKGNSESLAEKETRTLAEVANDKAYEAVIQTRKALTDATLVSPIDGVVTKVDSPQPGVNILPATSTFVVVNPSAIKFIVTADQTEVVSLHQGDTTTITLDSYPDMTLKGTVTNIAISPDPTESSTVYKVDVEVANIGEAKNYRIGMTGDANFVLEKKENVLFVAPKFVKSDKNGKYLTLNGNKKVYITPGVEGDERVEISGDIKEGEIVYDD